MVVCASLLRAVRVLGRYENSSNSELVGMVLQQFGPTVDDAELELLVSSFSRHAVDIINEERVFAMVNVGSGTK